MTDPATSPANETGFSLVETLVSMVVICVVLAGGGVLVYSVIDSLRQNEERGTATAVMAAELDRVRRATSSDLPVGVASFSAAAQGRDYVVTRNTRYAAQPGEASGCLTGADEADYKVVDVQVQRVADGELLARGATTVALGDNDSAMPDGAGGLQVAVQDQHAVPVADAHVQLTPGGEHVTNSVGCISVFDVPVGHVEVVATKAGHVTPDLAAGATTTVAVFAGSVHNTQDLVLAQAGTLTVSTQGVLTHPMSVGLSVRSSYVNLGRSLPVCRSAVATGCINRAGAGHPREAVGLFPGVYDVALTSCQTAPVGTTPETVTVGPGQTAAAVFGVTPVEVVPFPHLSGTDEFGQEFSEIVGKGQGPWTLTWTELCGTDMVEQASSEFEVNTADGAAAITVSAGHWRVVATDSLGTVVASSDVNATTAGQQVTVGLGS